MTYVGQGVDAIVITKITAIPIPTALSNFFETPINGQIPKNLPSTKLFINIEDTAITNKCEKSIIIYLLSFLI